MKTLLIGDTGLIGGVLKSQMSFDVMVHRTTVQQVKDQDFDLCVCAAPSSNRIAAAMNPSIDGDMADALINTLRDTVVKKIVLISTCDTQRNPDTVYGRNRLQLEKFIMEEFGNYSILRLPSLVHQDIKKNFLFDLKHTQYLDKANLNAVNQWYPLSDIKTHVEQSIPQRNCIRNLCSEPISNRSIVELFAPSLVNQIPDLPSSVSYNFQPYLYSRDEILTHIGGYLR